MASTWLALGLRTNVRDMTVWWCIPLLSLQFAIFYSFSVLLAVLTRSTVACVFGSVLFWLLSWAINYGRIMTRRAPLSEYVSSLTAALANVAYWIFPKPIDSGVILFNVLDAQHHFEKPFVFTLVESGQTFLRPCRSFRPRPDALPPYQRSRGDGLLNQNAH